jgi:hypothetical protein
VAIALCATVLAHARMDTATAVSSGRLSVPDPQRARTFALGFEPVIADWYWIQALQLMGEAKPPPWAIPALAELIELVTGLDPWVDHPYRFAALWLVESPDQVRRANRLLERGVAYHPTEWRNRFYLGYNHFFYLEDNATAATVREPAVGLERAPDYLGALATRLRASSDGLDTAAIFVQQLIASAEEWQKRDEYRAAFDEIQTERMARILDDARERFQRRNARDVREPAELWSGPLRELREAPPAHPSYPHAVWELDAETSEIVSSYYGRRYRLHVHPADVERQRKWRDQAADREGEDAEDAGRHRSSEAEA